MHGVDVSIFRIAVRHWTRPEKRYLVLNAVLDVTRSKPELVLENALLHQQLIVLKRRGGRDRVLTKNQIRESARATPLGDWFRAADPCADGIFRPAQGLPNDSFEQFQIDISSTDDRDHFFSFESLFSFEETPNAQGS